MHKHSPEKLIHLSLVLQILILLHKGNLPEMVLLEVMLFQQVPHVLFLFFLVLLKVAFLSQLAPEAALPALVGIPAAARCGTLISIFQFPYAREQGLGRAFVTYAPAHTVEKALVLALVPVFFCGPFYLALLGAAMLLSLWANSRISRKLGGVTGDKYGAVLEGSEMALLLMTAVGSKLADFLL